VTKIKTFLISNGYHTNASCKYHIEFRQLFVYNFSKRTMLTSSEMHFVFGKTIIASDKKFDSAHYDGEKFKEESFL